MALLAAEIALTVGGFDQTPFMPLSLLEEVTNSQDSLMRMVAKKEPTKRERRFFPWLQWRPTQKPATKSNPSRYATNPSGLHSRGRECNLHAKLETSDFTLFQGEKR
jgi:hypothetical protein